MKAIMGRRPPGFFWLFAIGELVSNKPCAIIHHRSILDQVQGSWSVTVSIGVSLSGDGQSQCRDETLVCVCVFEYIVSSSYQTVVLTHILVHGTLLDRTSLRRQNSANLLQIWPAFSYKGDRDT